MLIALELERVGMIQPVVRHFFLEAVLDLLLEHTVMVADTAAVSVIAACSQRIQEAGSETAETAVAESRIRLMKEIKDGINRW